MNFDDLQNAWQSQDAGAKMAVSADVLLKEVRRNQQQFDTAILRRDVLEVGTLILMTAGFLAWGVLWRWWSLCLLSLCCLAVGVFFLVDRRRQRRKQPANNDPLQACIAASLGQVRHQIWLLKNVFWWYLLPPVIGVGAVVAQIVWSTRGAGATAMLTVGAVLILTYGFAYGLVYWVNQRAVRKQLDPRRRELEALLADLKMNSP